MPQQTEPSANVVLGGASPGDAVPEPGVLGEHPGHCRQSGGYSRTCWSLRPEPRPSWWKRSSSQPTRSNQTPRSVWGLEAASNRRVIEAVIALRYPDDVHQAYDLGAALESARLRYCVFTPRRRAAENRFPEHGWLEGSVEDLADMVRLVSVPQASG